MQAVAAAGACFCVGCAAVCGHLLPCLLIRLALHSCLHCVRAFFHAWLPTWPFIPAPQPCSTDDSWLSHCDLLLRFNNPAREAAFARFYSTAQAIRECCSLLHCSAAPQASLVAALVGCQHPYSTASWNAVSRPATLLCSLSPQPVPPQPCS